MTESLTFPPSCEDDLERHVKTIHLQLIQQQDWLRSTFPREQPVKSMNPAANTVDHRRNQDDCKA